MAYSTNIDILNLEGGSTFPSATVRMWMLWTVLDTGAGGPTGPQQAEQATRTIQTDATGRFSFSVPQGPDNQYASRDIGLSIQDSNRVAGETGWWFRSGRLETLPNESIEVVLASAVDITQAEVDAALPAMPMTVDPQTTITSATAMLAADGFIDLVANGTTTSAGPAVTFTYTLRFKIVPSSSITNAETEIFDMETPDRGAIVFAGGGVGAFTAAILNAVNFFILREVFPIFRARLKSGINSSVISQIAGRIAPGTTSMPPGVIVSARSVNMRVDQTVAPPVATALTVRAALGAFGGVMSKFPSISTGGGTGKPPICPIVAISSYTMTAIQPGAFRLFRDTVLARSPAGRRLIDLYYRHSTEATRIVLASPGLLARSARLLLEVQNKMKSGKALDNALIENCVRVTRDIAERGSAEFREDALAALSSAKQNGYFGLSVSSNKA